MRIKEFAEVVTGRNFDTIDLVSTPTNYLYLQPVNVERGIAITEANAKYIAEKTYKKLTSKAIEIQYGDFLIYKKSDEPSYSLTRIAQDIGKKVVPSNSFIILKDPQSFLSTFLQHELGRKYFLKELDDIDNRANGSLLEITKHIRLIDIDPIILGKLQIDNYISPGNTSITEEELKSINVRSDVITIDNIHKRLKEGEIKLSGYFQRNSDLWPDDVKSRLIETIILNMPIPPLFFDVTNDDKWLIVDGLQRVSAIRSFYNNELELTNLDYIPHLQGKKYKDLERHYQRRFEEKQLSYFAIYPGTPRMVRYKIFKNINVSALVLNRQEIRHAINEDENFEFTPSRYLKDLTKTLNKYILITEKGERGKERMFDAELCLRYIAFRILNHKVHYKGSIQDYLDKAMESIYGCERNKLEVFKSDFESALITLTSIFPEDVIFTRAMVEEDGPKNFNSNLFGIWTYVISRLNEEDKSKLLEKSKILIKKAKNLSSDEGYERSIDGRYFETIENLHLNIRMTEALIKDL